MEAAVQVAATMRLGLLGSDAFKEEGKDRSCPWLAADVYSPP